MIKTDEDALICDLAETYHIYDYRQLPASQVAVFSVGLRENSRIKLALSGQSEPLETLLMASIYDAVNLLVWSKTKDGQNGNNRPKSVVSMLAINEQEDRQELVFDSGEDFMAFRNSIVKGAS